MLADEIERRVGQRVAEVLNGAQPGGSVDPVDVGTGRVQHGVSGRHHFRPDAVSGDFYDWCHDCLFLGWVVSGEWVVHGCSLIHAVLPTSSLTTHWPRTPHSIHHSPLTTH